jgi:hypothetical protein
MYWPQLSHHSLRGIRNDNMTDPKHIELSTGAFLHTAGMKKTMHIGIVRNANENISTVSHPRNNRSDLGYAFQYSGVHL